MASSANRLTPAPRSDFRPAGKGYPARWVVNVRTGEVGPRRQYQAAVYQYEAAQRQEAPERYRTPEQAAKVRLDLFAAEHPYRADMSPQAQSLLRSYANATGKPENADTWNSPGFQRVLRTILQSRTLPHTPNGRLAKALEKIGRRTPDNAHNVGDSPPND